MYFEKLIQKNHRNISNLFPNLQLIITGGVNYNPYKNKIDVLIGKKIQILQTFPASEGFFAYQNDMNTDELLLLTNNGIFYEFIPLKNYNNKPIQKTYTIEEIELDIDYALIISTNAGLWRYDIGDTIRFTSKNPYKIIITGRTTHYTSAFGEHVIAHEVESSLKETLQKFHCSISEFTVAPQTNPKKGLPYHEWLIEFETPPKNLLEFEYYLDQKMQKKNIYYCDLIKGKILNPLKIFKVKKYGFKKYMNFIGKLGGQNKIPRLSNNRKIANFLYPKEHTK